MRHDRPRLRASFAIALLGGVLFTAEGLAAPGDLDPSFGTAGTIKTRIGSERSEGKALALAPGGKIVVVGIADADIGEGDLAIARYHASGKLDKSFSGDGKAVVRLPSHALKGHAVAVQPDGRIIVAGHREAGGIQQPAVLRFTKAGRLDKTFSGDGKFFLRAWDYAGAEAVVVQRNGKIVVAGHVLTSTGYEFALVRLNPNGSPDTGFSGNGRTSDPIGMTYFDATGASAYALALQPDGKLVAAGIAYGAAGQFDFAVARYRRNGTLDSTFGTGGQATTPVGSFHDHAREVAVQPNGKIIVAGGVLSGTADLDFGMARFTAAGDLDGDFGTGGTVVTPLGPSHDYVLALALQPGGKIVLGGDTHVPLDNSYAAFARYKRDGALDSTFGEDGKVVLSQAGVIEGLAVRRDGRIVGGGTFWDEFLPRFGVAQLLGGYPKIRVGDAARREGASGTRMMRFPVRLSVPPGTSRVRVDYQTVPGTARAPKDYLSRSGTLTFRGAKVRKWVEVPIVGDTRPEGNERFEVVLSQPRNAKIARARATGTIRDDD